MGLIATDENKITLYYHSEYSIGKQTLAYAESSDKDFLSIDVSKTKVPSSHWAELAGHLDIPIEELVNRKHPDFDKEHGEEKIDLDEHDWLKLLEKAPQLLNHPIAIVGVNFIQVKNPSDLEKHISIRKNH